MQINMLIFLFLIFFYNYYQFKFFKLKEYCILLNIFYKCINLNYYKIKAKIHINKV